MSLTRLVGAGFGPFTLPVEPVRVADFVAATGDDPVRWTDAAPPGYAAAVLFAAAPSLLESSDVAPVATTVIHSDQSFIWHAPVPVGEVLEVRDIVASVRERGGLHFVGFEVEATCGGAPVLSSSSTFILSEGAAGEPPPEGTEPPPTFRGHNEPARPGPLPAPGAAIPGLARSASRLDLLRYAAASGDWNPIHWDHTAARAAGLPGIVVHGLLIAAWTAQAAARFGVGDAPVATLDLRFRRPLTAGAPAVITGTVDGTGDGTGVLKMAVTSGGDRLVTGTARVRAG